MICCHCLVMISVNNLIIAAHSGITEQNFTKLLQFGIINASTSRESATASETLSSVPHSSSTVL